MGFKEEVFSITNCSYQTPVGRAGVLVYWLWDETPVLNVMGLNPSIMDNEWTFFTLICY